MFTVFISESIFSSLRLKKAENKKMELIWLGVGRGIRTRWSTRQDGLDNDDFEYQELNRLKLEAWYRRKGDRKLEPEMNLKIF